MRTLNSSTASIIAIGLLLLAACTRNNSSNEEVATPESAAAVAVHNGEGLFAENCADCHNGRVSKAPPITMLQIMSASSILRSMDTGVMQAQAEHLSAEERQAVVEYISGGRGDEPVAEPPLCAGDALAFDYSEQPAASTWGMDYGNQRFYDQSITEINADNIAELELSWAFAFPGATRARSQPSTAAGAVFLGSQDGTVYALDQKTGCVRWTFSTVAEVRTGIVIEPWGKDRESLTYFGDLVGNVYAVDTFSGELVWRDRPDDHPSLTLTATPVLYDGQLLVALSALEVTEAADPTYACCTFRGGIAVYDAHDGELQWTGYTIAEEPKQVGKNAVGTPMIAPSGAPVWGAPTVDRQRGVVYVGTGENYSSPADGSSDAIIALSLEDGSIVWKQQMTEGDAWNMGCEAEDKSNCPPENGPDYDFGAATILATHSSGKELLLAGQKSGDVYALDPDEGGRVVWQKKLGRGGIQGGVHFGMAVDGDTLYVPMSDFDGGPRWPGEPKPGMYAVDFSNGEVQWYKPAEDVCEGRDFCDPGLSAAASAIPGAVVAGAMDGHLRAYHRDTGEVLWDFDSVREYQTVAGSTAQGGSFGGSSGPVFKGKRLFVNSGYGIYFHMQGNALLSFKLADDKTGTE